MEREERIAKVVSEAPESSKNCLKKAFAGTGGRTNAVKAMCLTCTGYDRETIKNCTGYSCPLWAYRPYVAAG